MTMPSGTSGMRKLMTLEGAAALQKNLEKTHPTPIQLIKKSFFSVTRPSVALASAAKAAFFSGVYLSLVNKFKRENNLTTFGKVYVASLAGGIGGVSLLAGARFQGAMKEQLRAQELSSVRSFAQQLRTIPVTQICEEVKAASPRALVAGACVGAAVEAVRFLNS